MIILTRLALLAGITSATMTMKVYYSEAYNVKNTSLEEVSCSNGNNGLITKHGWQTQEQIPDFPFIGGSSLVEGYNSAQCGNCYRVTYKNHKTYMTGIDHADDGLVMSKQGMDSLTANQAEFLGEVDAEVEVVHDDWCAIGK